MITAEEAKDRSLSVESLLVLTLPKIEVSIIEAADKGWRNVVVFEPQVGSTLPAGEPHIRTAFQVALSAKLNHFGYSVEFQSSEPFSEKCRSDNPRMQNWYLKIGW